MGFGIRVLMIFLIEVGFGASGLGGPGWVRGLCLQLLWLPIQLVYTQARMRLGSLINIFHGLAN